MQGTNVLFGQIAVVFGIVIVNAIRSRGVESPALITRYAIIAGLIAGVGLAHHFGTIDQQGFAQPPETHAEDLRGHQNQSAQRHFEPHALGARGNQQGPKQHRL